MFSGLCFSSLVAFKILSLSLTFGILSWVLVWDCFASSGLVLSHFLDLYVYFFCQVREIFCYYFFNRFSIPYSAFSPSGTIMMHMLVNLISSQRALKLSSTILNFWILFSFLCSYWVFSVTLYSKSLTQSFASMPLLIPYNVFFIQLLYSSILTVSFYVFYLHF